MAAVRAAQTSLKRTGGSSSRSAALFRYKRLIAHRTSSSYGGVVDTFDIV